LDQLQYLRCCPGGTVAGHSVIKAAFLFVTVVDDFSDAVRQSKISMIPPFGKVVIFDQFIYDIPNLFDSLDVSVHYLPFQWLIVVEQYSHKFGVVVLINVPVVDIKRHAGKP